MNCASGCGSGLGRHSAFRNPNSAIQSTIASGKTYFIGFATFPLTHTS